MLWAKTIIFVAALHSIGQPVLPRFQDYPAPSTWRSKDVKLRLRTYNEKCFLTRLTEAAKEPPDFAGHYKIAGWGCGSACASGALIDLKTGNIYPLPFGGHGRGSEYWIFTGGPFPEKYIEYRRDSRLIIIRRIESVKDTPYAPDDYYFVWDGKRFKQIKYVTAKQLGRTNK
jgi:hypothetical protein